MTFLLKIGRTGEALIPTSGPGHLPLTGAAGGIELPLLGLTGEYTRALHPLWDRIDAQAEGARGVPSRRDLLAAFESFTSAAAGGAPTPVGSGGGLPEPYRSKTSWIRKSLKKEAREDDRFWLWLEHGALRMAIASWLVAAKKWGKLREQFRPDESYLRPEERYLQHSLQDPDTGLWLSSLKHFPSLFRIDEDTGSGLWNNENRARLWSATYLEEVFRFRTRQVGTEVLVSGKGNKKHLTHLYHADSLLPLVWVEILWAIQNDRYAQLCEECGAAFSLDRPYKRKAYICSRAECRKARRIRQAGGVEKQRKAWRTAQRESREKRAKGEHEGRKRGWQPKEFRQQ